MKNQLSKKDKDKNLFLYLYVTSKQLLFNGHYTTSLILN